MAEIQNNLKENVPQLKFPSSENLKNFPQKGFAG
jgi:hypothetical protein